jgi:hypothetical protein
MDWERLGVLLGVQEQELGSLIAAWPRIPPNVRQTLGVVVRTIR